VGELAAALDHQISALQTFGYQSEDAHFEISPIDFLHFRRAFFPPRHLFPPPIRNPTEIELPFGRIDLHPFFLTPSPALPDCNRPLKSFIAARRNESEHLDNREERCRPNTARFDDEPTRPPAYIFFAAPFPTCARH